MPEQPNVIGPENPKAVIYLRNRMKLKRGAALGFLEGKQEFLRETKDRVPGGWKLVASAGDRPIIFGEPLPECEVEVIQIWQLAEWDTLFASIYLFSEEDWYRRLGSVLDDENQELLVNITSGEQLPPRKKWVRETDPGYIYLYEEARVPLGAAHRYLRELHWFAAKVKAHDWERVWAAGQITARPATLCSLWRVPNGEKVEEALSALATDADTHERYRKFASIPTSLTRKRFHPTFTERLDEVVVARNSPDVIPVTRKKFDEAEDYR